MPLIYNGQETGGNQALDYFNDTKIDWNAKDEKMRNTLRTLFALKHVIPALSDNKKATENPETQFLNVTGNTGVLAYTRTYGDSQVLVLLNMSNSPAEATITGFEAGAWSLWLNSETIAKGTSRKQETFESAQSFALDAKGYRVYVRGTFPEEDTSTNIHAVLTPHNNERWYDLSGRTITTPIKPGIYIKNGRKMIVNP